MQSVEFTFNTKLFDCTDDRPSCFDVICCGYCMNGKQYSMMHRGTSEIDLMMCGLPLLFDVCIGGSLGFAASSACIRMDFLREFGFVNKDDTKECCTGFWCSPCSSCQVHRELSMRGQCPTGMCCVAVPYQHPTLRPPARQVMVPIPVDGYVVHQGYPQQQQGYPPKQYPY